jgi:DNA-binding MarR family transcriptional regulator
VLVTLTDAGAAAQQRTGARHARSVERRMTAALSPDDLRTLHDLCERLGAAQAGLRDQTGEPAET